MSLSSSPTVKTAFLALLVEDHKLSKELPDIFITTIQKMATLTACNVNKIKVNGKAPTSFNQNKITYSKAEPVQLEESHPYTDGIARKGFKFTKPKAEVVEGEDPCFYLGIPTKEEGLPDTAGDELSFHDFMKAVSDEACIGGNVPNAALNAALMTEALQPIDDSLEIIIATPDNTILSTKLSERIGRMNSALHVRLLSYAKPREGLHIPIGSQNIMINSESPTIEEIMTMIEEARTDLEECLLLYSGDHRLGLNSTNSDTRLIPSTASKQSLTPNNAGVLLLNENELAVVMKNAKIWSADDVLLAVTNVETDTINTSAIEKTNFAFRKIAEAFLAERPQKFTLENLPRRIAQIGMDNGKILDVFIVGEEILFMETSAMKDHLIDRVIECANSEKIQKGIIDKTGRGDAAAAATILDGVDPEKFLTWWGKNHSESSLDLSAQQKSLLRIMLSAVMSRFNAKIVHHTPGSNFFDSIDAEGYRGVLDLGMGIAINLVLDMQRPEDTEPQTLRDEASQMKTTIWKTALKE